MNSNTDQPVFEHTNDLSFDDDSTCLLHALLRGSLVIVHDGPFMPPVSSQSCSFAFVLYCSYTDKRANGSFAEQSENADYYRGEWLGCIGALQVLLAVLLTSLVLI